jgi:Putative restriction endonuclease
MPAGEVANTSLEYDRTVNLALYARNGIPEVWIVNLAAEEEVEIYQSPVADGYASVARAGRSDVLTINAIPDVRIRQDIRLGRSIAGARIIQETIQAAKEWIAAPYPGVCNSGPSRTSTIRARSKPLNAVRRHPP